MVGRSQHEVVVRALEIPEPFNGAVRLPWQPMARTDLTENTIDHVGTITEQLPEEWTTHVQYQWQHGTDAYAQAQWLVT
eukprot:5341235-Karenia_brevis.AAC.1